MNRTRPRLLVVSIAWIAAGCVAAVSPSGGGTGGGSASGSGGSASGGSASDGSASGSGGAASGSGGSASGSGGLSGTGGGAAAGGTVGSGGSVGSGGNANGSGGTTGGTGGRVSGSGGATASGGRGGATASGGRGGATTTGTGGALGSGGAGTGGAGGAGTQPFKGVANSPCNDLVTFGASWFYNWTTSPGSCKTPQFVPMISGKNEKTADAVTSAINTIAKAGYKTVLGFNEPNKSDQSNLTVAQVVALWPQLTANADIRVSSPATSADGQSWFNDFMTQVSSQNLRVDFIALHWYGWNAGSCDAKASQLESYVKWAEGIPGSRPIWITEWGCMNASNPDAATVQAFYAGALAMFARHPRIERYAWYPWNTNNELVDASDALTPLGAALSAAPAYK